MAVQRRPEDSNIRIAPTLPPLEELEQAMEVFVCCVKLAAVESLLADNVLAIRRKAPRTRSRHRVAGFLFLRHEAACEAGKAQTRPTLNITIRKTPPRTIRGGVFKQESAPHAQRLKLLTRQRKAP